jgi:hypothetical protein
MSTHPSRDPRFHEGERKPAYVPIAVAIMIACPLISCFLIDAQGLCNPPWPGTGGSCGVLFTGYAGPANYPYLEIEGACIIFAGSLVGYLVFIWRSATRGYSYNSW